ncbi:MAG TPA: flagella basal body P-ring formation protein FlgA [Spirochaetota bacterium]|nr:flagella basal body P-ring formation protein FlgA [Spirochaetota bacterium]HPJ35569.1 flagella basal body P-ring formation protein FlgA [Spirochaetota bacterium]
MIKLLSILILLIPLSASARVRIYLIPEIECGKQIIVLSDIAKIEGDYVLKAGSLVIPAKLYKDSIVDRRELNNYLSENLTGSYSIFGSGVKLSFRKTEDVIVCEEEPEKTDLVKKGQMVELMIKKGNISIEMSGKALSNGTEDDEIDIRLKNGRVLRGRPCGEGRVIVIL